jgi:chromosome segregation ATPase
MNEDQLKQISEAVKLALKPEFDNISKQFKTIDKRFESIESKLKEHDDRFDKIEVKLKEHDDRFDLMMQLMGEIDDKVDQNHQEALLKFDQIYNVLDSQNKAIERIETEFTFFSQHIDAVEAAVRVLARSQNISIKLYGD